MKQKNIRNKRILTVFIIGLFMTTMVPMMLTNNSIVSATSPNPTVTTNASTNVTFTNAILNGYVSSKGSSDIIIEGFKYGTTTSYGNYANKTISEYPGTFVYAGGEAVSSPGGDVYYIRKYWTNNLTLNSISTDFGNYITEVTSDCQYLYASSTANSRIAEYWIKNMTKRAETTLPLGSVYRLIDDEKYFYGDCYPNGIQIFYKNNMTPITIIGPNGIPTNILHIGTTIRGLAYDDNYIYAGGTNGRIAVITRDNWRILANITYPTPLYTVSALSRDKTYLYVGAGQIIREYTIKDPLFPGTAPVVFSRQVDYGSTIRRIAYDNTYVYVCGISDLINQYWKNNLTLRASVDYGGSAEALACDNTYVYGGGYTTNAVKQYWRSNMTLKSSVNYGSGILSLTVAPAFVAPANMSINIRKLQPGQLYHYKAFVNNTNSTGIGADMTLLTYPYPPVNASFRLTPTPGQQFHITWTKQPFANKTIIRGSNVGYPLTPTSGTLIYNGSGSSVDTGKLVAGDTWYYSAWSYTEWGPLTRDSINSSCKSHMVVSNPVFTYGGITQINSPCITVTLKLTSLGGADYCILGYTYWTLLGSTISTAQRNVTSIGSYGIVSAPLPWGTTYNVKPFARNQNGTTNSTTTIKYTTAKSLLASDPGATHDIIYYVLPALIAVAILLVIVGMAFTLGATKEGLITIMIVSIIGIIVIQIIMSL